MSLIEAVLYGVIQGLTEFIPVSSSGHLALLPHILHIKDPGVIFDLSMHMGTVFSIILYFRKEIWSLFCFKNPLLINMIISTIATMILVVLLKGVALKFGRINYLIEINLVFFGLLMLIADKFSPRGQDLSMSKSRQVKRSWWIGIFQALAIFPGVSRSGATLTISRWMGLTRAEASRYSFLLSLPIILAGFLYKAGDFSAQERSFEIWSCLLGGVVSFVVGLLTIHLFLKLIERIGLSYFAYYRILLAILLVLCLD